MEWVLTFPHRLRYRLAWDHELCRAVVGVAVRTVLGFLRHVARLAGVVDGRGGAVAIVQRFGGAPSDTWAEASPAVLPALAAVVVYGALVARCLGRKRPADETAGVAMNCAYLPNAILCLIAFAMPDRPGGWQIGAWVTLVACVCSVSQIVLVMRGR